jgi:hypothetical protein
MNVLDHPYGKIILNICFVMIGRHVEARSKPQQSEFDSSNGLLRVGARTLGAPPPPQSTHQGSGRQHRASQEVGSSQSSR